MIYYRKMLRKREKIGLAAKFFTKLVSQEYFVMVYVDILYPFDFDLLHVACEISFAYHNQAFVSDMVGGGFCYWITAPCIYHAILY